MQVAPKVGKQSRLYRCAPEHLRNLSQRESENPEVREAPGMIHFPQALGSGVFQYQDLTSMNNSNNDVPSPSDQTNSSSNPTEPPSINPPVEVANIPKNPNSPNTHNLPNSPVPNNTEEIQPDAEPDANSQPSTPITPNNQDENNNPHPSPYPLHDLPNTIPRGGLDVSVPDTDEGEDSLLAREMTQDHWEIKKGKVIRHHVLPRSTMFNPVSLDDIPVPLELLES